MDDRSSRIEERIQKASDSLVFASGIRGWNMDDCASDAGITKRTLYRYRRNKAHVVEDVLIRFIRSIQLELAEALNDTPDARIGLERLLTVFPKLIRRLDSKHVQDMFRQYPDLETEVIRQRESLTAEVADYLRHAREDGQIRRDIEPSYVVELVQALILHCLKTDPENLEAHLRIGLSIILHGLLV